MLRTAIQGTMNSKKVYKWYIQSPRHPIKGICYIKPLWYNEKKCRMQLNLGKSDSFNYHMVWRQGFEINKVFLCEI